MSLPAQRLRVLPRQFVVDHHERDQGAPDDSWLALVRAPEGCTVVRDADDRTARGDVWAALYGDDPHGLDQPGMLAGVVAPLGASAVPVFVVSTFHADLVLVPAPRLAEALAVLRAAGHEITA